MMLTNIALGQVVVVGNPPAWGPAGYTEVRYYYIPDVQAYYDISSSRFIYYENDRWIRSASLPTQYRSYDLYRGYKQPLRGYKGNSPHIFYPTYKIKYKPDYRAGQQISIGPKPDHGNHGSNGSQGSGHNKGFQNHPNGTTIIIQPGKGKQIFNYPNGGNGSKGSNGNNGNNKGYNGNNGGGNGNHGGGNGGGGHKGGGKGK